MISTHGILGEGDRLRQTANTFDADRRAQPVEHQLGMFQESHFGRKAAAHLPISGISGVGGGDHALGPGAAMRTDKTASLEAMMRGQAFSTHYERNYVDYPEDTPGVYAGAVVAPSDVTKTETRREKDMWEKSSESAAGVLYRKQLVGNEIGQVPLLPTQTATLARSARHSEYDRLKEIARQMRG